MFGLSKLSIGLFMTRGTGVGWYLSTSLFDNRVVVAVAGIAGNALLGMESIGPLLHHLRRNVFVTAQTLYVLKSAYRFYLLLRMSLLHLRIGLKEVPRHVGVHQPCMTLGTPEHLEDTFGQLFGTLGYCRQVGGVFGVVLLRVAVDTINIYDRDTVIGNLYNAPVGKRAFKVFFGVMESVTELGMQEATYPRAYVTGVAIVDVFVVVG